jgi:hypothetical protein
LRRKPAAVWTAWAGVSSRDLVAYTDASEEIDGVSAHPNLNFEVLGTPQPLPAIAGGVSVLATTYAVTLKATPTLPRGPFPITLFYKSTGNQAAVVASAFFPWRFSWCVSVGM